MSERRDKKVPCDTQVKEDPGKHRIGIPQVRAVAARRPAPFIPEQ